jgi:hypothetical protein
VFSLKVLITSQGDLQGKHCKDFCYSFDPSLTYLTHWDSHTSEGSWLDDLPRTALETGQYLSLRSKIGIVLSRSTANDMTSNPSSSIFPPLDDIVPKSDVLYSATYTSREKGEMLAEQVVDHIVEIAQRELNRDQKSTLQPGAKGGAIEGE